MITTLLSGMLIAGYLTITLFFARFWHATRDRLFLMFAGAFALLAVQRVAISLTHELMESQTALYAIRLLAFLVILAAIIDRNRR